MRSLYSKKLIFPDSLSIIFYKSEYIDEQEVFVEVFRIEKNCKIDYITNEGTAFKHFEIYCTNFTLPDMSIDTFVIAKFNYKDDSKVYETDAGDIVWQPNNLWKFADGSEAITKINARARS